MFTYFVESFCLFYLKKINFGVGGTNRGRQGILSSIYFWKPRFQQMTSERECLPAACFLSLCPEISLLQTLQEDGQVKAEGECTGWGGGALACSRRQEAHRKQVGAAWAQGSARTGTPRGSACRSVPGMECGVCPSLHCPACWHVGGLVVPHWQMRLQGHRRDSRPLSGEGQSRTWVSVQLHLELPVLVPFSAG